MAYKPSNYYEVINDIINTASIVDVISHYIQLKKKGTTYFGLCPFHNDSHPSLAVSPKKKIFKCFVCGVKGNVIKFVQQYEKCSYFQAVKKVAQLINYDLSKLDFTNDDKQLDHWDEKQQRLVYACKRANEIFEGQLFLPQNKEALNYLLNRGLNQETIKHFHLGYAPNSDHNLVDWLTNKNDMLGTNLPAEKKFNNDELIKASLITDELKSIFINRITFPIFTANNTLVGFTGRDLTFKSLAKYLHSPSSSIFNKSNILYNFNNVIKNNPEKIIVVEGQMDCIAYYCASYPDTVATMGTALTENSLTLFANLNKLKTIILSFDNDNAGINATITNGKTLIEHGYKVSVVNYDKLPYKDVDEILKNLGKQAVDNIINTRLDFLSYYIIKSIKPNLPSDELLNLVDQTITYLVEYGDVSLRSKYISLISDLTNLNSKDLEFKYDELKKKAFEQAKVYVPNKKIVKQPTKKIEKTDVQKAAQALADVKIEEGKPQPLSVRQHNIWTRNYVGNSLQLCKCLETLIRQVLVVRQPLDMILKVLWTNEQDKYSAKDLSVRGEHLIHILECLSRIYCQDPESKLSISQVVDKAIEEIQKDTKKEHQTLIKCCLSWLMDFKNNINNFVNITSKGFLNNVEQRVKQTLETAIKVRFDRLISAIILSFDDIYNDNSKSKEQKAFEQNKALAALVDIDKRREVYKKLYEQNKDKVLE